MDPDNPCLRTQQVKIGLNPSVLTFNMISFRKKYDTKSNPYWKNEFTNWPMIEQACVKFASDLLKESRIIEGKRPSTDLCQFVVFQSKAAPFGQAEPYVYGRGSRMVIIHGWILDMTGNGRLLPDPDLERTIHPGQRTILL
ncbi:hypothetical protein FALCPG4_014474 [Fusarium falciforme]